MLKQLFLLTLAVLLWAVAWSGVSPAAGQEQKEQPRQAAVSAGLAVEDERSGASAGPPPRAEDTPRNRAPVIETIDVADLISELERLSHAKTPSEHEVGDKAADQVGEEQLDLRTRLTGEWERLRRRIEEEVRDLIDAFTPESEVAVARGEPNEPPQREEEDPPRRSERLREAIEHLHAGGFHQLAERLQRDADHARRRGAGRPYRADGHRRGPEPPRWTERRGRPFERPERAEDYRRRVEHHERELRKRIGRDIDAERHRGRADLDRAGQQARRQAQEIVENAEREAAEIRQRAEREAAEMREHIEREADEVRQRLARETEEARKEIQEAQQRQQLALRERIEDVRREADEARQRAERETDEIREQADRHADEVRQQVEQARHKAAQEMTEARERMQREVSQRVQSAERAADEARRRAQEQAEQMRARFEAQAAEVRQRRGKQAGPLEPTRKVLERLEKQIGVLQQAVARLERRLQRGDDQ